MILKMNQNKSWKDNIKTLFIILLFWGLGYGAMWFSKWVICDIIYKTGTIKNAFGQIFLYTNNTNLFSNSILDSIRENIKYLLKPMVFIVIIAIFSTVLCKGKGIKNYVPILIIGILPFLWSSFAKVHSYMHARFTFRILLITIFVLSVISMTNIKKLLETYKKKNN